MYLIRRLLRDSKLISLAFVLSLLASCVGTIEDKNPSITKGAGTEPNPITFSGIHDARAIADTKIDVFFFPAQGDVEDLTYIITFDSSPVPITVPAVSLRPDYRGLLRYTIRNLKINTNYNFVVQVMNKEGRRSDSPRSLTARTISNITANFDGIAMVRNMPGADGLTSLRVEWPEAERLGTEYVKRDQDVEEYVITLVDSDELTPGDLNDPSYGEPLRKVITVPGTESSRIVSGLTPGKDYHVSVRAIHHGFKKFGANLSYKLEANTYYLTQATLSTDSEGLNYDPSVVSANRLNGSAGLSSIQVTWDSVEGAFDHYRVYYNPTESSTFSEPSDVLPICYGPGEPGITSFCKKVSFNESMTVVTDLLSLKEYEVNVVICVDADCTQKFTYDRVTAFTDPGVAIFAGIVSISNPRTANALDEIYINVTPPDVTSGNIDGLLVEIKDRDGGPSEPVILNHPTDPTINTTSLSVGEFNYVTANEITIKGINPSSATPYCFTVFPFFYDENGEVEEKRGVEVERCITPELNTPDVNDFSGITGITLDTDINMVTINWAQPDQGLYDSIEVFVRVDGGLFSFSEAVAGAPGYLRYSLPNDALEASFPFLNAGTYSFGVLTLFSGLQVVGNPGSGYSDFNNSIELITVD